MNKWMKVRKHHIGKQLLRNNRGSSSVLVILIMVTLAVLGLLALMSTWSGLKLSRKNADWAKAYYTLDSKAEFLLSGIDSCLKDAAEAAEAYMLAKEYEKTNSSRLPADFQKVVHDSWQNAVTNSDTEEYTTQLYQKLYYMYSIHALREYDERMEIESSFGSSLDLEIDSSFEGSQELEIENESDPEIESSPDSGMENRPGFEIRSSPDFGDDPETFNAAVVVPEAAVIVSVTVTEESIEGRSLLVELVLGSGRSDKNGASTGTAERYRITAWKELPAEFELQDTLEFEDLEVF